LNYKRPILAIDDEYYVTKAICHMMSDEGVECILKTDPTDAMEIIRARNPLVVVLDVNMPNMDGNTLCKKIKEEFDNITVFMLSARGTEQDIATGIKSGASDYILKPFSPVALRNKIMAVFSAEYNS
jgi:DNA-binding response OmpR family regulator